MPISDGRAKVIRQRLLAWYAQEARDLPWRQTRDPYAIWVSEVMLQQTRVETVLRYFDPFLAQFPTVHALATATRGDVLKGLLEGVAFFLKACVDDLPETGIQIADFRAVGGGSKSDAWIQLSADIFGVPFVRPQVTEAGALGAAIIAGTGSGVFDSYHKGVEAMVRLDRTFVPDPLGHRQYQARFEKYQALWPLMREYLTNR